MGTKTRTFPISLKPTTTTAITEVFQLRNVTIDPDDELGIYLEAIYCNGSLASFQLFKFPDFDGDESEAEKLSKFTTAENASQKFGLKLLTRKSGETGWREKAEIIMVNRGRKDYFDLLNPYLTKKSVRILEQNDEIAIQLVDYGYGLLKDNDFLELEFAIRIESEKKNNEIEQLRLDLETLKLAIDGRLTELPANTLLGRDATTGAVQQIPQSRFAKPADIDTAILDLIGGAPGALNTLDELAQALSDDTNFATTITNQVALKAPVDSPTFTGNVSTSGILAVTNTTQSTSTTTGTLVAGGGIGVSGNGHFGGILQSGGRGVFPTQNTHTYTSPNDHVTGVCGTDAVIDGSLKGWQIITYIRPGNANFGVQLALCDTEDGVRYRRKTAGTWSNWRTII
ncbi:hypothetical protein QUB11_30725 [Microcoleus sp. B6-A1]|uniref:hypothetical protein n=1 Tax=Microcoleus sp. B6-A1 TaxID=2818684 RepID=UPI002FD254DC